MCSLSQLENVREPVVICGLSMGGYVAFEFWNRYPERVKALILCDTRAAADNPEGAAIRRAIAGRVLVEGTEAIVDPMVEKLLSPNTLANQPEVVQNLNESCIPFQPRQSLLLKTQWQLARTLRSDYRIKVPCLLWWARMIPFRPLTRCKRWLRRFPTLSLQSSLMQVTCHRWKTPCSSMKELSSFWLHLDEQNIRRMLPAGNFHKPKLTQVLPS